MTNRRPETADIKRMGRLLVRELENGAWGVSGGLDFALASFVRTDEVIGVLTPTANWRTHFTNHDRVTADSNYSSLAGMAETVAIGKQADILPVITHMKVQGHEQGSAAHVLTSLMPTNGNGTYVAADAYPYVAGQAPVELLIIPGWAREGGRAELLKRLADPLIRTRIADEVERALTLRWRGPEGVYLMSERQELTHLMKTKNVGAGEVLLQLVEKGWPTAILRFGSESDLIRILQHPGTSMACDCGATTAKDMHPRFYGSFPRFLGRYVREQQIMSREDAIRKSTALPAATIGMVDRVLVASQDVRFN